jgi:hypothetical protein
VPNPPPRPQDISLHSARKDCPTNPPQFFLFLPRLSHISSSANPQPLSFHPIKLQSHILQPPDTIIHAWKFVASPDCTAQASAPCLVSLSTRNITPHTHLRVESETKNPAFCESISSISYSSRLPTNPSSPVLEKERIRLHWSIVLSYCHYWFPLAIGWLEQRSKPLFRPIRPPDICRACQTRSIILL